MTGTTRVLAVGRVGSWRELAARGGVGDEGCSWSRCTETVLCVAGTMLSYRVESVLAARADSLSRDNSVLRVIEAAGCLETFLECSNICSASSLTTLLVASLQSLWWRSAPCWLRLLLEEAPLAEGDWDCSGRDSGAPRATGPCLNGNGCKAGSFELERGVEAPPPLEADRCCCSDSVVTGRDAGGREKRTPAGVPVRLVLRNAGRPRVCWKVLNRLLTSSLCLKEALVGWYIVVLSVPFTALFSIFNEEQRQKANFHSENRTQQILHYE